MSKPKYAQLSDLVEIDAIKSIDHKALLGHWINSNPDTISIARINITEANGKLQLQVFAVGPDGPIDWGTAPADVFSSNPASSTGTGFTCTYDFGFAEARFQAMIMKGLLVLAQFHTFKDDSNRASYFMREYYAMTHEHFDQ
ncbi:MAG TPA: hypothetical protein VFX63_13610 [Pyrinomonadaceae bacterium]|nr:hypothetical protein [Pyrinomonadaceae bacterium]